MDYCGCESSCTYKCGSTSKMIRGCRQLPNDMKATSNPPLRGTSFGLIEQLLGPKPLKPKRTLRLWPGLFPPRSPIHVYLQKLVWGRFSSVSRASLVRIETVLFLTLSIASNYNRMPHRGRSAKQKKMKRYPLHRPLVPLPRRDTNRSDRVR
jgi:hypothetical protein